jgi:Bacterial extracellular solute-binding proteins, family 3
MASGRAVWNARINMSMRSALAIAMLLAVAGPAAGQDMRPTLDKLKEIGVIHLGPFSFMEQVAFSHMIFVDGASLLATTESGIATVKDLAGKRVGVIPNTTTEKARAGASVQATVVSVGDREMLEHTKAGDGPRLAMLVLHDDATREYA